ncbi:hypothetical protein NQ314_015208 [Rhamnusium bicolor]|uniref:Uncharacterized protein n=1 Tax=Rhamnusium bicolor TaxID=1586634 RepID=A0AAV8WZX9_9CUCU|nr:hypothetical protein NQ314_015208 [Rhamnusium bicolor]
MEHSALDEMEQNDLVEIVARPAIPAPLQSKKKRHYERGRPEKTFENVSERLKRQKTKKLRAQHSPGELSYAAQMSQRSAGQIDASKAIKDITTISPKRALKYRTAYKQLDIAQTRKLQGTEALSMFIDAAFTREQYNKIRRKDSSRFPSYKKIQLAKKKCYRKKEVIIVTETSAEVKVQLLDRTVLRISKVQEDVLKSQGLDKLGKLCLITKWGFDGYNQLEYKQRFTTNPEATDANIFIALLVVGILSRHCLGTGIIELGMIVDVILATLTRNRGFYSRNFSDINRPGYSTLILSA